MKKILIYYPLFNCTPGGGEFLPFTFIAGLQKQCEVTLALDRTEYFELNMEFFHIKIDMSRLRIVRLIPKKYGIAGNRELTAFRRFLKLKKLAKEADVCISCANIVDFGRPAHYFLYDANLSDDGFVNYVNNRHTNKRLPLLLRLRDGIKNVLRKLVGMRSRREIIRDQREHIYPNSNYVGQLVKEYYGDFNGELFYPVTIFDVENIWDIERDPLKVVYLGRMEFRKRIEDIVAIVERAREMSGKNITLSIAGHMYSDEYCRSLKCLTAGKDWINFPGEVYGEDKAKFLLSGTFALHAMREEGFGISITEYLKAGLVPIVPDDGGACEVVNNPELSFRTVEDAAAILTRLLNDAEFMKTQRDRCAERAKRFTMARYLEEQRRMLDKIVLSAPEEDRL